MKNGRGKIECFTILVFTGDARRDYSIYEDKNADKYEKQDAAHLEMHFAHMWLYDWLFIGNSYRISEQFLHTELSQPNYHPSVLYKWYHAIGETIITQISRMQFMCSADCKNIL